MTLRALLGLSLVLVALALLVELVTVEVGVDPLAAATVLLVAGLALLGVELIRRNGHG